MKILHHWFRSGPHSILAHADFPEHNSRSLGVVMVPPLGWDDICSYRPLHFVARSIAESGFPVLRFDLPGTGDSSGDALDPGLLQAWVESVRDAASELRALAGVEQIALAGVRMGALLALLASKDDTSIRDLILWGAVASGRSLLRELRAFAAAQLREYGDEEPPPQPVAGFEVGGFLISPETQRDIESIDFSKLPEMPEKRVLLLTRDELPVDAKLVRALQQSGCALEVRPGRGFSAMMAIPHEAVPPFETARTMADFLKSRQPDDDTPAPIAPPATRVAIADLGGIFETSYTVDTPRGSIFGILCEPGPKVQRGKCCLLFLNPGATRHIGPNRMWVEAARRWAARGVVSLRLDLGGIGESDGETVLDVAALYQDRLVEEVEMVMDSVRARFGINRFVAVGLCSGAFWALHAAARNSDVRAAVMLNPRLYRWDPEVDRLRALRRTVKGLTSWTDWRRMARGDYKAGDIKRLVLEGFRARRARSTRPFERQMQAFDDAAAALERHQAHATIIFTEGEPLLNEMQEQGRLPLDDDSPIRCVRIPNGGHTLRPLWIQKLAHELIDQQLEDTLRELRPEIFAET